MLLPTISQFMRELRLLARFEYAPLTIDHNGGQGPNALVLYLSL